MTRALLLTLCLLAAAGNARARDFEENYAVFGAGAQPCNVYLLAVQKGGNEQDFFIDWLIGYLSAFNLMIPETYNILGETDFPTAQRWLEDHCRKYPNELFINAVARLTEVLYPSRYQSSLKNPPEGNPAKVDTSPKPAAPRPSLKDIKIR
jgi:hypothetical protein